MQEEPVFFPLSLSPCSSLFLPSVVPQNQSIRIKRTHGTCASSGIVVPRPLAGSHCLPVPRGELMALLSPLKSHEYMSLRATQFLATLLFPAGLNQVRIEAHAAEIQAATKDAGGCYSRINVVVAVQCPTDGRS